MSFFYNDGFVLIVKHCSSFYGAPVGLIFTVNRALTASMCSLSTSFEVAEFCVSGSWIDMGYFLQSVAMAARARGLETVSEASKFPSVGRHVHELMRRSQQSVARLHPILRERLQISEEELVLIGMAVGYPDLQQISQLYARPSRRPVSDIAVFEGFDRRVVKSRLSCKEKEGAASKSEVRLATNHK